VILAVRLTRRVPLIMAIPVVAAALGATAAAVGVHGPCKVESGYFCIQVVSEPPGGSRRTLILDDLTHSYVDLRNPRDLRLPYLRVVAAAVNALAKPGQPVAVLHVGGGAFALPRYISLTRPGSVNNVMEIDPAVVDAARVDFGFRPGPRLRVKVGDARVLTATERTRTYDFVVGDAFSSRSPPWHLTTEQFLGRVRQLLRPRGAYLMNVIDSGQRFVRAEAATLRRVFPNVALLELPGSGNHVLAGANVRLDAVALASAARRLGVPVRVVEGAELQRLIGGAHVLQDDFAPVDQLLK
jgi:hypothetical protein